ncbi:MAG: glycosyltransferase [Methanomassiliicoccales archaeon]|nr:MAG: glycosyltransferase [Methanomassiliicoccales archaeon]
MKVALVHDWLTGMRGGERCLEVFCELFPNADLFTLFHVKGSVSPTVEGMNIATSFLQNFPFLKEKYRFYLPLYPSAIESLNVKEYNLIVSISHSVAKGIVPGSDSLHISYVLTPMRYVWDMYHEYFGNRYVSRLTRTGIALLTNYLRSWDVAANNRIDHFICISDHVAKRVKRYYQREGEILHPPVDVGKCHISNKTDDFYLIVSAFAPYKKLDIAIHAFNQLKKRVVIIGKGQEEKRLKSIANSNIEFLGWQPDEVVAEHYSKCKALIFPGEEDFGITPLEAMASGRPVIAYGKGGVLETVVPLQLGNTGKQNFPTGVFFYEQTVGALIEAVETFESNQDLFDAKKLREHAKKWDRPIFKANIKTCIEKKLGTM